MVSIPSPLHIITLYSGILWAHIEINLTKKSPKHLKTLLTSSILTQPFILQYPFPPKSQSQDTKVSEVAPKEGMLVTYADMSLQAEPQKNSINAWILISFPYFCILHSVSCFTIIRCQAIYFDHGENTWVESGCPGHKAMHPAAPLACAVENHFVTGM